MGRGAGGGGAMDGCGRCMKLCLIAINFVAFVGGGLALSLGAWVAAERSFPGPLLANNMFVGGVYVVVVTGAAVMLLSVLGCAGAAREVKCMLLTYYIMVFIVFVTMLVGGVILCVFREKIGGSLERELRAALPYYGNRYEYTAAWDDTQSRLQCCGVRGYRDWNDNIPESCCKEVYPGKRQDCRTSPNPTTLYVSGCLHVATDFLQRHAVVAGAAAIVVAFIMIFGLIFSCGLFMKIE